MRFVRSLLLAALSSCSEAPPLPPSRPSPAASVDEHQEFASRSSADARWVQRQLDRNSSFLNFQRCAAACKEDGCLQRCGAPPRQDPHCVSCSAGSRCQLFSEGTSGQLDCCLPILDERACFPAPR
jgi:hypothetical protein